jgi:hypothetical protein
VFAFAETEAELVLSFREFRQKTLYTVDRGVVQCDFDPGIGTQEV